MRKTQTLICLQQRWFAVYAVRAFQEKRGLAGVSGNVADGIGRNERPGARTDIPMLKRTYLFSLGTA